MTAGYSQVRWGVVGCGQIGVDKSIPGLLASSNACLVAIADPLPSRRELALGLARQAGLAGVRAYPNAQSLFADPSVDAVYIALPTGSHAQAVKAAAEAGKGILCEKPLGRSTQEVCDMVCAARRNGVPLMTAYMSRFSDVFQKAVRLVQDGAIGKVTYVSGHFSYVCQDCYPPGAPGGWRWTDSLGGGPLLDIGIYLAFGIREILGERIAKVWPVNCNTVAPQGSAIRDTAIAAYLTEQGTPGTFVATFAHTASSLSFFGVRVVLSITDAFQQTPGASLVCKGRDIDYKLDTRTDSTLPHYDNYRREFEHFSSAWLVKRTPSPAPEEVIADTILLDILKQSIAGITVLPVEKCLSGSPQS